MSGIVGQQAHVSRAATPRRASQICFGALTVQVRPYLGSPDDVRVCWISGPEKPGFLVLTHKIIWVLYGVFMGFVRVFYGLGFSGFFIRVKSGVIRVKYGVLRVGPSNLLFSVLELTKLSWIMLLHLKSI